MIKRAAVPLIIILCTLFLLEGKPSRAVERTVDKPRAEHLTGAAAEAFIAALLQKYPSLRASMERSAIQLKEKGWRPTGRLNIAKVGNPPAGLSKMKVWPKLKQMIFPTLAAQTAATGEGYAAFWDWDDGDERTWEGQILSETYAVGNWQYSSEQLDVASDPSSPYVLWSDMHDSSWVGNQNMDGWEELSNKQSACQPSLKSVKLGGKAAPACGCGGCNWKYRYKFGVNACWQRNVFSCLGRMAPQVVAGCSIVGRVGMFGECVVGAGGSAIIGCQSEAVIERFNACGWCG